MMNDKIFDNQSELRTKSL